MFCFGGVLDIILLGFGEEELEWFCVGDVIVFIVGCGDDDLDRFRFRGVLDFILGGEDFE